MAALILGLILLGSGIAVLTVGLWIGFGPRNARGETYGHPENPVAALKRRLPKAPIGFLWELAVERDQRSGHLMLKLALLDTSTFKQVVSRSVDLEWDNKSGQSWSTTYARWSTIRSSIFRNDLILPIADWARQEASQRGPKSGVEHHEIIT